MTAGQVSFGARLRQLESEIPNNTALTLLGAEGGRDSLTFAEFSQWSTNVAWLLKDQGVTASSVVAVSLGNSLEHFAAVFGAWNLGAMVLPLNSRSVERERSEILSNFENPLVVANWSSGAHLGPQNIASVRDQDRLHLPDITPSPGKAVGSGGSTGRPKVIVDIRPLEKTPGSSMGVIGQAVGFHECVAQLVPGALFHNMPFTWSAYGLFEAQHVVVLERFDAQVLIETVASEDIDFMTLVPTMMRRVAELPEVPEGMLSSLRSVLHSGAPCPQPLKRRWLELMSPERLFEAFGATEAVGHTVVRGDVWLNHPGTVGRPIDTEIRILDEDSVEVAPGTVGEIFMRPLDGVLPFRYIGTSTSLPAVDGFVSLGDLGSVDEDGFLFPADRRLDLVISGGANIYPAEVEAVLLEHPRVADAVVIGLPDPDWGKRVHALVEVRSGQTVATSELEQWCRHSLAAYKVPKSFEIVPGLPRNEAGKIRRRALVDERVLQGEGT